jgi:hypothetical protein
MSIESVAHAEHVWKTLSAINVNENTEKRGRFTYLSWAWALTTMKDNFPEFRFIFSDDEHHTDGTVTVHCTGFIGEIYQECWLPVMNHKNEAITNPDARKISDNKMRCLAKCIALFGLGLYIYAGEDLPDAGEPAKPEPVKWERTPAQNDALLAVGLTLRTFIEDVNDRDELKKYWKDNKQALLDLQAGNTEIYDGVLKLFKERGKIIAEKEGEA